MDTHLNEGNQLADDQPDVKHLEVGGVGEDLPHVDDDRCQHQHRRQVHPQGRFKERRFEEHGKISWKKLLLQRKVRAYFKCIYIKFEYLKIYMFKF